MLLVREDNWHKQVVHMPPIMYETHHMLAHNRTQEDFIVVLKNIRNMMGEPFGTSFLFVQFKNAVKIESELSLNFDQRCRSFCSSI